LNKEFFTDLFYNIEAFDGLIYIFEKDLANVKKTWKWFRNVGELLEYRPPDKREVYFGVFVRKNRIDSKSENCTYTNTIWVDMDGQSLEEINELIQKYNIPKPSAFVSTGGREGKSFHLYWFINKKCFYPEIIGILIGLGNKLGSCPGARKKTQLMRLPGSKHNKETGLGSFCKVFDYSGDRYSLEDFKEFNYLQKEKNRSEKIGENLQLLLDKVDWPCIKNILNGVPESERNFALYRIVAFLKHRRPYTKHKVKMIVKEWNELNTPPKDAYELLKEFKGFWEGEYKLGCKLPDPDQQRILSKYCLERECPVGNFFKIERDTSRDLPYNNRLFSEYKDLHANEIVILGVLISFREGLNFEQLKDKLTNKKTGKPFVNDQLIRDHLKQLKTLGWIIISPAKKSLGLSAFYKFIPQNSFGLGETLCSFGATLLVINNVISPVALKLYLLLCKYSQMNFKSCYPSLYTLAEKMGVKKPDIVYHMNKLNNADVISKTEVVREQNKTGNVYRCLI